MLNMDSVGRMIQKNLSLDANNTLIFLRQLENIERQFYEFDIVELKYREKIPVKNDLPSGAKLNTYRMMEKIGEAKVGNGAYANDLPLADAKATEHTSQIKVVTSGFKYSFEEIRNASMAGGLPLENIKSNAAIRAIREGESRIAWNGNIPNALKGLLSSNQGISTTAAVKLWSNATADEIIADVLGMVQTVWNQSKETRKPDTLLLPSEQFLLIAGLPRSTNSDTTVLNFIRENMEAFGLTDIDSLPTELDLAFVGGTADGALMYQKSPDVLQQIIPMEVQVHQPHIHGTTVIFAVESKHGGTIVRYPLGLTTLTGI
jgi:hypothetical protein